MNTKIRFVIFMLFFWTANSFFAPSAMSNSCLKCHVDYFEDMKASVHSKEEIFCDSCHGGNATQKLQKDAHDVQKGYVGVPDKKMVANICGKCHADVERMNFFGIPTDQLAQYKTSHHGRGLFQKGMNDVAVCSDCHSYHDVVKVNDPTAPVHPLNVTKTCEQCHGNEKLMNRHNLPFDIPEKYKNSVHGKALMEKGDTASAQCVSCHGSHGANPPQVNKIVSVCGKCHINERKFILESVHAKLVMAGKFPECIACHRNHDVGPANLEFYELMCLKCHQKTDSALIQGERILTLLKDSERMMKSSALLVRQAGIDGFFIEDEEAILEEVKTKTIEFRPLQHTLDFEKISKLHVELKAKNDEIDSLLKRKRKDRHARKLALVFIWIFISIMILTLWKRYKQYTRLK
ncbi:MAG: hypothetical protein HYV97_10470 [Bdellovibrio sp.]|nr:hypothetical protein [Bdellovibrio sp.]